MIIDYEMGLVYLGYCAIAMALRAEGLGSFHRAKLVYYELCHLRAMANGARAERLRLRFSFRRMVGFYRVKA